jgi:hypothetical protein
MTLLSFVCREISETAVTLCLLENLIAIKNFHAGTQKISPMTHLWSSHRLTRYLGSMLLRKSLIELLIGENLIIDRFLTIQTKWTLWKVNTVARCKIVTRKLLIGTQIKHALWRESEYIASLLETKNLREMLRTLLNSLLSQPDTWALNKKLLQEVTISLKMVLPIFKIH